MRCPLAYHIYRIAGRRGFQNLKFLTGGQPTVGTKAGSQTLLPISYPNTWICFVYIEYFFIIVMIHCKIIAKNRVGSSKSSTIPNRSNPADHHPGLEVGFFSCTTLVVTPPGLVARLAWEFSFHSCRQPRVTV